MKNILETAGYNTLQAGSTDEGLKKFEQNYDVISLVIFSANLANDSGLKVLDSLLNIDSNVITLIRTTGGKRGNGRVGEYMAPGGIRAMMTEKVSKKKLIRKVNRIFTVMKLQKQKNEQREAEMQSTL